MSFSEVTGFFQSLLFVFPPPPVVKMSAVVAEDSWNTGEAPDGGIYDMEGRQSLLVCQR